MCEERRNMKEWDNWHGEFGGGDKNILEIKSADGLCFNIMKV